MAPKLQKRCSEAAAAVAAVEGSRADSDLTPKPKKGRLDLTGLVAPKQAEHTMEEVEKAFSEAVKKHPFHDNADHTIDFHTASVFRDAKGKICGVLLPGALPSFAAAMAADVLRPAATKTSLRSNMFGGQAPLSGIAGYFDYRGSPVELKCRKTSFTHEHVQLWPGVFPMIEYVSAIYKAVLPEHWAAQDAAVPDVVRIHGSPFSTLTINQRFRTASHTDAGDFDMGYGVLAVLEGNFKGLSLALDDFGVCFRMQPRDVLLFNTHFFHSNTEPEVNHPKDDWDRLTCVFYYRAALGEASCVTEYKRRLVRAREIGAVPPPVVDAIVQKDNGDNFNKPAPTFPPQLTPFGGAAGVLSLHSCVTKLQRLHELLLEKPEFGVVLFGEPLRTDDGLLPRGKEQLIPVHLPVVVKAPPSGGFTEASDVLKAAEERQYFFEEENLANELGPELVGMWSKSRALWLQLVKEDWERLLRNNPERTRFNWNNTSAMNAAFFDLCEVAKQMMLGILDNENPSKAEEQSFWMLFAAHLNTACATEIGMPRDAMGMRKLNVKLKDFHFGGTRYLKDMPPEEQQRRLERKRQIEEARRRGCVSRVAHTSGWLQNDAFDYQHEDREVDFEKNGWVRPEENAQRLSLAPCANGVTAAADPMERIHLLVVLPRRAASGQGANRNVPTTMSDEAARLLKNPAAQRLLAGPCRNGAVTSPLSFGCVTITFVFDGDDVSDVDADFVILQHVLAAMESDEEAEARISFWASLAKHCVFIIEADTMDRHHYLLREEVRVAYEDVAAACFTTLHAAAYCTDSVHVRRTPSLLALTKSKGVEFRYKFIGSPLNTVALLVRGSS